MSVFTPVVNAATTADSTFSVTVAAGAGIVTPTDPETQKPAGADVTFKQTATLKLQPATTGSTTFGGSIINNSGEANLTLTNQLGATDFYVTYAASAAADTAPGTYTDTLTYTLTAINSKP